MAIIETPRFGLKKYTAGTDPRPTRIEFNDMIDDVENNGIVGRSGPASERPSAGLGHRFYYAEDQGRLYWDDGAAWQEISPIGGGGAGTAVVVGGAGAEGASARAARADHSHNLPLATSSVSGALSAADKAKLDNAVSVATASRLVIRDAAGRAQFATPSATSDAANKGYVDGAIAGASPASHNHDASAVTSGEFDPARLPAVTVALKGAMLAADKAKLDAAASIPTASTLVYRDASGRARFADPATGSDAANKTYVDAQISGHGHALATTTAAGYMSAADKEKLDNAVAAATASRLMIRDASGRAKVAAPSASDDIATKGYADTVGTGKRSDTPPFGHMGMTRGTQFCGNTTATKLIMDGAQVLKGGMTYDDANDALVVPTTGWYEVVVKGFSYAHDWYEAGVQMTEAHINSVPSGIEASIVVAADDDHEDISSTSTGLRLINAGEKVQLFSKDNEAELDSTTWGTNGYNGTYLEVRWYAADS